MTNDITAAIETALRRVSDAASLDEIDAVSGETLGKKGVLGGLKASLANIDDIEERKAVGRSLNEGFASVSAAIDERRQELIAVERASQVAGERLDLTEAMDTASRGHLHLVTQAWQELEDVFVGLGFTVAEGPEVETDWHNFEALNMSEGHPARGEFDTLFIGHDEHEDAGDSGLLLRTHTSPVQIRTMLTSEPPIYIVAPGRVFRRDTPDATHMPVFHQIEGLSSIVTFRWPTWPARLRHSLKHFSARALPLAFGRHTSRSLSLRLSLIFVAQMVPGLNSGVVEWFIPRYLRWWG